MSQSILFIKEPVDTSIFVPFIITVITFVHVLFELIFSSLLHSCYFLAIACKHIAAVLICRSVLVWFAQNQAKYLTR